MEVVCGTVSRVHSKALNVVYDNDVELELHSREFLES
jgi:hypothetical protein